MSKKQTTNTTQTNTYDPTSMSAFKTATNQLTGYTTQWLGANGQAAPQNTNGFNMNYQANLNQANAIAGRNIRNASANALALGGNSGSGATQAILAQQGRAASNLQAQSYLNAYTNALNQQNAAAGMAGAYKPLQTGGTQNTTQVTGGVGSWLPQLAGAAIGAGMGVMTGGASTLLGAAAKSATSAGTSFGSGAGFGSFGTDPYTGIGSTSGDSYWGVK